MVLLGPGRMIFVLLPLREAPPHVSCLGDETMDPRLVETMSLRLLPQSWGRATTGRLAEFTTMRARPIGVE